MHYAHFSLCVHTFFTVRFAISSLILPLCRLLLPASHYRRQQPDHSGKLLIVCIRHLNFYAHICAPFRFVCFGKSFVVRSHSLRRIRCCRIRTGKKKSQFMLRQYCSTPERRSHIVCSTSAARFWCWRTVPGRAAGLFLSSGTLCTFTVDIS